jgi:hypothetical protein
VPDSHATASRYAQVRDRNLEQELSKNVGVFGRLGWNDGKTESFAFTRSTVWPAAAYR